MLAKTASTNYTHSDIFKQIERHTSLPARMVKFAHEHMVTLEALYPDRPEKISNIKERLYHSIVDWIKDKILNNANSTLELSLLPKIMLEYKRLDTYTIVYRFRYMGDVHVDEWKQIKGRTAAHSLARRCVNLLYALLKRSAEEWE